jgi:hypothetical protein
MAEWSMYVGCMYYKIRAEWSMYVGCVCVQYVYIPIYIMRTCILTYIHTYIHTYIIHTYILHSALSGTATRPHRHCSVFATLGWTPRCRKPQLQQTRNWGTNLESGDTQEAAPSHWDHEGSRAGADDDAQLKVKNQNWGNRVPGQIWLFRQTI